MLEEISGIEATNHVARVAGLSIKRTGRNAIAGDVQPELVMMPGFVAPVGVASVAGIPASFGVTIIAGVCKARRGDRIGMRRRSLWSLSRRAGAQRDQGKGEEAGASWLEHEINNTPMPVGWAVFRACHGNVQA
ncbi:MAG: hypothetical protein NVSMB1_16340 [Polyangiales bacterium]